MVRLKLKSQGFTLIEVLIALVIIAIALAAVIKETNSSINTSTNVRNTMFAHWVAMDILSEMQTHLMKPPKAGSTLHGKTAMAGQSWHWIVAASSGTGAQEAISKHVVITVSLRGHRIRSVSGYILNE